MTNFVRFCLVFGIACFILFTIAVYVSESNLECTVNLQWSFKNRCNRVFNGSEHPWHEWHAGDIPHFNIAVAVIADWYFPAVIRDRVIENKRMYCAARNYTLIAPDDSEIISLSENVPVPWAKFPLLLRAFGEGYDFVFMVDADTMIMRNDIDLRIPAMELIRSNKSILISTDMNSLNSGVFLIRNTALAHDFLCEGWHVREKLGPVSAHIPLRYENRAFFYLTNMWPRCGQFDRADTWLAPRYDAVNASRFRDALLLEDRCLFNVRPYHVPVWYNPLLPGTSFDNVEHAFVVHAAGLRRQVKLNFLNSTV